MLADTPVLFEDGADKAFGLILELERKDLESLLSVTVEDLKPVKTALKKTIGYYMGENL